MTKIEHNHGKMEYVALTQEEKDDVIISFLRQQEMDHLCHSINKERYEKILDDKEIPDGEFKERIQKLKDDIETRIFEVEKIIEHTRGQLPPIERINSSIKRINITNISRRIQ